jgi:hypothetical protein
MNSPACTGRIRPHDIDALAKRFQGAEPFPNICIDDFLEIDFANAIADSFPSFEDAKRLGRGFDAVNERGKYQITDSSLFPEPIQQLHNLLGHPDFLTMMERLSGITPLVTDPLLVGGGIHQTGPRGHLDVHVDFNFIVDRKLHRRLNILIFFNRYWQEAWGGNLELWDAQVNTCHHSFAPIFNRCCIFQTSEISFHGVTAVKCPPLVSRKSFAAYFYTQETDDTFAKNVHSTIFRARPDEVLKRNVWMPLEHLGRAVRRGRSKLIRLLKRQP